MTDPQIGAAVVAAIGLAVGVAVVVDRRAATRGSAVRLGPLLAPEARFLAPIEKIVLQEDRDDDPARRGARTWDVELWLAGLGTIHPGHANFMLLQHDIRLQKDAIRVAKAFADRLGRPRIVVQDAQRTEVRDIRDISPGGAKPQIPFRVAIFPGKDRSFLGLEVFLQGRWIALRTTFEGNDEMLSQLVDTWLDHDPIEGPSPSRSDLAFALAKPAGSP